MEEDLGPTIRAFLKEIDEALNRHAPGTMKASEVVKYASALAYLAEAINSLSKVSERERTHL